MSAGPATAAPTVSAPPTTLNERLQDPDYRRWLVFSHALHETLKPVRVVAQHTADDMFQKHFEPKGQPSRPLNAKFPKIFLFGKAGDRPSVKLAKKYPMLAPHFTSWENKCIQLHSAGDLDSLNFTNSNINVWHDKTRAPWELAKVFVKSSLSSDPATRAAMRNAESSDATCVFGYLDYCKHSRMQGEFSAAREARNKWAHACSPAMDKRTFEGAIDALVALLHSPTMPKQFSAAARACATDIIKFKCSLPDLTLATEQDAFAEKLCVLTVDHESLKQRIEATELRVEATEASASRTSTELTALQDTLNAELAALCDTVNAMVAWKAVVKDTFQPLLTKVEGDLGALEKRVGNTEAAIKEVDAKVDILDTKLERLAQVSNKTADHPAFSREALDAFVHRDITKEIALALTERSVLLVGDPGTGKSSIAASLRSSSEFKEHRLNVCAVHVNFQEQRKEDRGEAREHCEKVFLKFLTGTWPVGFSAAFEMYKNTRKTPLGRLQSALSFMERPADDMTHVFVVDGLDEAPIGDKTNTVADFVFKLAGKLPSWFRVFATCRRGAPLLSEHPLGKAEQWHTKEMPRSDEEAVLRYIDGRVKKEERLQHVSDRDLQQVAAHVQGNFLLASLRLDNIELGAEPPEDPLENADLAIADHYRHEFVRHFGRHDGEQYKMKTRPLLDALVANLKQADCIMTREDLYECILWANHNGQKFKYHQDDDFIPAYKALEQYLHVNADTGKLQLVHTSLFLWLLAEDPKDNPFHVLPDRGHRMLAVHSFLCEPVVDSDGEPAFGDCIIGLRHLYHIPELNLPNSDAWPRLERKIKNCGSCMSSCRMRLLSQSACAVRYWLLCKGGHAVHDGDRTLFDWVVSQHNADAIKALCECDRFATAFCGGGMADGALRKLVDNNQKECLDELLQNDRVASALHTDDGRTPLMLALHRGHSSLYQHLICAHNDSQLTRVSNDQWTAAMVAASHNRYDALVALEEVGTVEWHTPNAAGDTALTLAVRNCSTDHARSFCVDLCEVNVQAADEAILCVAAARGCVRCVKKLCKLGADVAAVEGKRTPLMHAAERGFAACVGALLDGGADAGQTVGVNTWSALMSAACKGHIQCVKRLMALDKAEHICDALRIAIENKHPKVVRMLCRGVNEQQRTRMLCLAAARGHHECLRVLVVGRDELVDRARGDGRTPLMLAAAQGHVDALRVLLCEGGANVNLATPQRNVTALMLAARERHCAAVAVLIECGADKTIKSAGGQRACDLHDACTRCQLDVD